MIVCQRDRAHLEGVPLESRLMALSVLSHSLLAAGAHREPAPSSGMFGAGKNDPHLSNCACCMAVEVLP